MTRYDNEKIIIKDFQCFNILQTEFLPCSIKTLFIYFCIHNKLLWKSWTDSSKKNMIPPDFYNERLKLMMEVMRVDDHAYIDEKGNEINKHNQREGQITKMLKKSNSSIKEIYENGNLFIIPNTVLEGEKDHNYNRYINNFKRVLQNHINKISNYKRNHPGYKTLFFVLDESIKYIRIIGEKQVPIPGKKVHGYIHHWWLDKNMIEIFKNSNIDYLIWMAPYKKIEKEDSLPKIIIFDIKKIKYDDLELYPIDKMQIME